MSGDTSEEKEGKKILVKVRLKANRPNLQLNKLINNIKPSNRSIPITELRQTESKVSDSSKDPATDLDDITTDEAIDDIVINESNQVLAIEDAKEVKQALIKSKPKRRLSFKDLFKNKWTYICLPIIVIIAVLAIPYTRYKIIGLVLSHQYQFSVIDSTTSSPVGGAVITVSGHSLVTSPSGDASLNLSVGKHPYTITKHLYKTTSGVILVGILKPKPKPISLVATGRQIAIVVTNKLTGQPISGADISVIGTSSSTNSKGQTSIVLPTKSEAYLVTISANGYNKQTASVSLLKKQNSYAMVPSGSLFFLTDGSSVINVTQTNLDGSDPQILVAGSGHETTATTFLMPSPDWKYLLLEANRDGTQPELYIVDTSTGDLTEFDSSPDQFNLIGWSGDNFIYDEINQSDATSMVGREQLKSYDAGNATLNILDQNQVDTSSSGYAYQTFSNFHLMSAEVVYYTNWNTSGTYDTSTLTSTIRGIQISGINKDDFETFATPNTGNVSVVKNSPSSIYFEVPNTSTSQTTYYDYTSGTVSADSSLSSSNFSQSYPTYYISPSGSQSLWTQTVSSTNQTFIGDQNGQNQKQLNLTSGMSAFSWYDNVYLLLTKDSMLYIEPVSNAYPPTLVGTFLSSAS